MKHNLRQFFPGIDYDSGIVKLSGGENWWVAERVNAGCIEEWTMALKGAEKGKHYAG